MKEFSVTSGTVFHSRKLSFKKLLMVFWEEMTAVKGLAALLPSSMVSSGPHCGRSIGYCLGLHKRPLHRVF